MVQLNFINKKSYLKRYIQYYSKLETLVIKWAIFERKLFNLVFRHKPKTLGAGHEQFGICPHQAQLCSQLSTQCSQFQPMEGTTWLNTKTNMMKSLLLKIQIWGLFSHMIVQGVSTELTGFPEVSYWKKIHNFHPIMTLGQNLVILNEFLDKNCVFSLMSYFLATDKFSWDTL